MKLDESQSCGGSLRTHWGWSGAEMALPSVEGRAPMLCNWRKQVRKNSEGG